MSEQPQRAPDGSVLALASVTGLETFRAVCQEAPGDDFIAWRVGPLPPVSVSSTDTLYALFGDLQICQGGWFVGTSVRMLFDVPDDADLDCSTTEGLREVVDRYGLWGTHVMWDHAAAVARTVAALSPRSAMAITIPPLTPETEFLHVEAADLEQDQED